MKEIEPFNQVIKRTLNRKEDLQSNSMIENEKRGTNQPKIPQGN